MNARQLKKMQRRRMLSCCAIEVVEQRLMSTISELLKDDGPAAAAIQTILERLYDVNREAVAACGPATPDAAKKRGLDRELIPAKPGVPALRVKIVLAAKPLPLRRVRGAKTLPPAANIERTAPAAKPLKKRSALSVQRSAASTGGVH